MTNEPKVSVVMTVYNGEKYLRAAVDSILSQTFKDFEFIIINDGSTDRTQEILESYNDSRIVLIHQERIGFTKCLNKGIALSKSKYIARQDADDISMPERLEKQLEFLDRHKDVALLGTAAKIIDERGVHLHTTEYPCDYSSIRRAIKQDNCFFHGSVMFKRQSFFEVGCYREFSFPAEDYDLWLRFVEKFKVANLSSPLYERRFTFHSITFKNIVFQARKAAFVRQLARARENEIDEPSLIEDLNNLLESPLSSTEKKEILQRYNQWTLLMLRQNKKDDAFLLISMGINHASIFYKILFRIIDALQSMFLLKIIIKTSILFDCLKKKREIKLFKTERSVY